MRDLGLMGENTVSLWCAEVGLVANGSRVDKTGWDFFVEFPFQKGNSVFGIHKPAFECKVQVKATDKKTKKLPITISNLRRMITVQMPAFFIFIEFDGKTTAQEAYLVHVDKPLITKVLKKMHELENVKNKTDFNKRTITIKYENKHKLENLSGLSLKEKISSYIGEDIGTYISDKKKHLETTGFEDGSAKIIFTTEGNDNLDDLIDASLGLGSKVRVSRFTVINKRFGITCSSPVFDSEGGLLQIPDLKPNHKGIVKFKESNFSPSLSFEVKLYSSVLNQYLNDDMKKIRLEGEFFDFVFKIYSGESEYSFSIGHGNKFEIKKFRDALKLFGLITSSGKTIIGEMIFDKIPNIEFHINCNQKKFEFFESLESIEKAIELLNEFNVTEKIDISLNDLTVDGHFINQFHRAINTSGRLFQVEFDIIDGEVDFKDEAACICILSTPIGTRILGVIMVIFGSIFEMKEGRFKVVGQRVVVERKMVSERGKVKSYDELRYNVEDIVKKYEDKYSVINLCKLE